MTRTIVVVASVILLAGCASKEPATYQEGPTVLTMLDALSNADWIDCQCFYSDYGYASIAACQYATLPLSSASGQACAARVVPGRTTWLPALQCAAAAAIAKDQCYARQSTCDPVLWDACDTAWMAQRDACLAPCAASDSACTVAFGQFTNAIASCGAM